MKGEVHVDINMSNLMNINVSQKQVCNLLPQMSLID